MIEQYQQLLEENGAHNVLTYTDKLRANMGDQERFQDLLFEGRAALMFLANGFSVGMRESPDLSLNLPGHQLYAEVKHFRLKRQDKLDEDRMKTAEEEEGLVEYGDIFSDEDGHAWDQIVRAAKNKCKKYFERAPLILVVASSSLNCIDDLAVEEAMKVIANELSKGICRELHKLNGILLMHPEVSSREMSNVYFFETPAPRYPLNPEMLEALRSIRIGFPWPLATEV